MYVCLAESKASQQSRRATHCLVTIDFLQAFMATRNLHRIRLLFRLCQSGLDLAQLFIAINYIFKRDAFA